MREIFYRIAALTVMAVFYGCYTIKMLLQKRKGITTDQIGKGKTGQALIIEMVMKVATYLTPAAELYSIFCLKDVLPDTLRIAGIALGITGDVVFIISVVTMKDSWRAGVSETDRTELITDGIYAISRNPAFLAFDLVYAGILLMYFSPLLLIISAFAAVMFHLQIVKVEERFLLRTFGEPYREYREHVNRYIGRRAERIKRKEGKER